jgi:hypothetical protein
MMRRRLKASNSFTVYWLSLLSLGSLFSGCSSSVIVKNDGKATVIYVAPTGNDTNPGTLDKPLATLYAAQQKVRGLPRTGRIIVSIADGSYYLDKPLLLDPADSGTRQAPVIWRAVGDKARLVGGALLRTSWEKHTGTIWKTAADKNIAIEQVFINEQRRILARYPNDSGKGVYNGAGPTWERMKSWKNPETAFIHALHSAAWGSGHILVQRNNAGELVERIVAIDTTTQGDGGWLNETKRFAENVFEELYAPGEWFFDKPAGMLYYQPVEGEDLVSAKVEAIGNPHLVMLEGKEQEPVRFVTFDGLVFAGAAPTWKRTTDHLPNGGDYVVHRGGAMTLRGTEDCAVQNCTFSELGGNAVFLDSYNRRSTVRGCLIRNIGANGIALCGAADSMRGEEFFTVLPETLQRGHQVRNKWAIPVGWQKIPEDLVPGPKTMHYPSECVVKDNLITVVGELEKQSAGVLLSLTMNNSVSHNTIFNLPRAGICVQDGAWGGHIIEYNDVFDTVKETADHGPFNSWGKDRYWLWADHSGNHAVNPAAKTNCLVDALTPTHIRNNRFAHPLGGSHSWGIDLDDGSTHYMIYNNLCVGCAVKLREGFYRTVENNVFIGSGGNVPGKHVCFDKNEDIYRKNIVVNLNQAWVWRGIQHSPQEMKELASNCYFAPGMTPKWGGLGTNTSLEAWQKLGLEKDSIIADPLFVDPASGNYQVRSDSPALKLGFKNFPMDKFGVTSEKLRKWVPVRTFPVPGDAGIHKESEVSEARIDLTDFLGGKIKNMTTEAEKSAVGTGEISGVLVDKAPAESVLAKAGFRVGDLMIKANGKKVDTVATLLVIVKRSGAKSVDVQIHDDSKTRMLVIPGTAGH